MSVTLPSSAVERIDDVCDRFEAAWKSGQQPRVDDYLDSEADPVRAALLTELLRVDTHYRQRALAPQRVGPCVAGYELLGELGRGGMGVVYKARQLRPNRLVALKMISAGAHAGARERERFRREADAVAQLQHPHIVQVYEVGEQDGNAYFALEYVAGGSLDRYLAGTPQPPHAAAQLVERLALAVHHAHERGIIHRDLKPANVLLSATGDRPASPQPLVDCVPKLTDFGLAKLLDAAGGQTTQSGELLGTPSYMAPEQVGGAEEIGAATDVYGLGAILYEMLTGRPPFRGETTADTILQVQTDEPVSPSRLQPKCPRDLVTICLKCLRKPPRERYASALDLAEDLRRFLGGEPIRARPVGPLQQALKWAKRKPAIATLTTLLVMAVTAGIVTGSWFWWQAEQGLKTTADALGKERLAQADRIATLDRYQVALAHREWLANNVAQADTLLDSCTDAQRQTWEWRYLDRLRRSALLKLPGHGNTVQAVAIHPKRQQAATASHDSTVRVWNLNTAQGRIIGSYGVRTLALAVAYSPDGRLLASSSSQGVIKLWNAETGEALPDLVFEGQGEVRVRGLAFDSSSRYLAAGGPQSVKVWDTLAKQWVYNQASDTGAVYQVAFSPDPDSRYLATASRNVRVWDWKSQATKPLHDWPGHGIRMHDLAFNPDGNLLASGGRDGLIRVHSLQTGQEKFTLDAHQLSVTSVCFSPDGERLASAGQEGDMHVWNVKERRRLFTLHGHSGAVWDLAYTPKGGRLISAGSDSMVRAWDAATSQEAVTLPFKIPEEVRALTYGPGGRLLAWGDARGTVGVWDTAISKEVLRRDVPASRARNPLVAFAFRPDGRQLAWRRASGPATLWDLEKGTQVPLPAQSQGRVLGLAFSADGKQLLAAQRQAETVHVRDLLTGQELLTLPGHSINQFAWTPDARHFVTIEDRKYVRLWLTDSGRLQCEFEHQPTVTHFAFSGDGRFLALGGIGGRIRVWNLATNRETMAETGHASNVYGLALSPDGRRLASAASDCTAKLWDTQTGHEVLTLRTQLYEHSRLAFSPDGADLASVNMDNQIQIWTTRGAGNGLGK